VPELLQRERAKQGVLGLPQSTPVASNLQAVLQQEAPLKREMIRPLTTLTPGSHCSVPSTIPFPQTPGLMGVWVCEGLTARGELEAETPPAGVPDLVPTKKAVLEGVADCEAPLLNDAAREAAVDLDCEAPVEKELVAEAAPVVDCEAPVENELVAEAAPVVD